MTALDLLRVFWFFVPAYAADMSPIFARELFPRLDAPIDGGRTLGGPRLLGSHKTWRGLAAAVVAGVAAWEVQRLVHAAGWLRELALVDYSAETILPGFLMGLGAGLGDAAKSFFKRRVGIAPGRRWLVFDQLDFFAGAVALTAIVYVPPLAPLLALVPIVFLCEILATTVFWWFGLKESWI